VIEEMSVPAGLRLAFTELFATLDTLHSLAEKDSSWHQREFPTDDIYAVPKLRIDRSALYAVMGNDGAAGTVALTTDLKSLTQHDDGVARISWPGDATSVPPQPPAYDVKIFDEEVEALANLARQHNTGGRIIPNPVWKLLPENMAWLLKGKRGPVTTVHPLGGCAMADDVDHGVVDDCGRVFAATSSATTNDPTKTYDGLVVLDGSIIPTALGTNPALTITAVAVRAAEALATDWQYDRPGGNAAQNTGAPAIMAAVLGPPAVAAAVTRPVFRETDEPFVPTPTEVEIIERLVGPVRFKANGKTKTRIVELTLRFVPKPVRDLARPPQNGGNPVLDVATDMAPGAIRSQIRIYDQVVWEAMERLWTPAKRFEKELDDIALFSAPVTGSVRVFERQPSVAPARRVRASVAYLANRGFRDIVQAAGSDDDGPGWWQRAESGWALASRSGEVRALVYDLTIGTPDPGRANWPLHGTSRTIRGEKRFTYGRRANPWRQLMEVELDKFPGLRGDGLLKLDPRYLARIGVPLFRITKQQDGATALAEIGSFIGYFLRLLLGLHIWSFRAPDEDTSGRQPKLLPRADPADIPIPAEVRTFPLPAEVPAGGGDAYAGKIVLTRYPRPSTAQQPPILMLHGYSASGTTFAHPKVPNNFASEFWKKGRDVWIADLRTSPAHEPVGNEKRSAERHWSFEQIAAVDIPEVFRQIEAVTGHKQLDVIAHCMGTVVFSMAVLAGHIDGRTQVRRAAFTQVGPLVVFSPANVFRAYALRYFLDFLPEDYTFRPTAPTLADDLWDRLLATLPYPEEEFDIENPPLLKAGTRTPWTRTRHRMDALYGRDFNLVNMEQPMLEYIDDHFGALSLRTVSQTLHFVRHSLITNYRGDNDFVSREHLQTYWKFPTFSVHGADNGLAHVSTVDRMGLILKDAGCQYLTPGIIPGAGHQDALVGNKRAAAIALIDNFLSSAINQAPAPASTDVVAYTPWIGPIITEERDATDALVIRLGAAPTHHRPVSVLMIRALLDGERVLRPDNPLLPWDANYVAAHAVLQISGTFTATRWDAFDAPLPSVMPGSPGNALLVLVIYAESPDLDPQGLQALAMLSTSSGTPTIVTLTATGHGHGVDPGLLVQRGFTPEYFRRAAAAAVRALLAQPLSAAAAAELPLRSRPGNPVLLAAARMPATELAIAGTVQNVPQQLTSAQLVFGTNLADGTAVVEAIYMDHELIDGVVPYDPPAAPPAAPDPNGTRFVLMSCQYPGGFLDGPVAYAAYRRVHERLAAPAPSRPRFAVLTGDQVYVDPTAGLYDPSMLDNRYRLPYEAWLRQREVRGTLRQIPSFMLLDDHEIDDNWEPLPATSPPDKYKVHNDQHHDGVAAYRKYQRGAHLGPDQSFEFRFDGFPFFMLDTRSDRRMRSANQPPAIAAFDPAMLPTLENWLTTNAGPKFIVTPAMFLPRHRRTLQHPLPGGGLAATRLSALHSDGWDGYPEALAAVLGLLAKHSVPHVVFLSGDEHRGCVASIELRDAAGANVLTRAHSIHTTAAYAPFPFANSLPEDFVTHDAFEFEHQNVKYQCAVNATLPTTRDGATLLHPYWQTINTTYATGAWRLDYEYADGGVHTLTL
jgi:hypothetical protein